MRGRKLFGRMGLGLAVGSTLLALPPAAAVAAGSSSAPQAAPVNCPTPPLPTIPTPGCNGSSSGGTSGSGGSSGSSGSSSSPGSTTTGSKATSRSLPPDQILSDETTFTQFAYVTRIANIYSRPSTKSHRITKLKWYTEDGFNSTYLLLRAHWTSSRSEWIKIRVPGRPNGRVGWVQRGALGRFHMTHEAVVVNREKMRLYFYDNGSLIWSAPVGVGAPSMPTPTGHFWINERFVISSPSNGYYPYAFGTTDYSTLTDWPGGGVVGIHGPYGAPASAIPGRISHGCIRLRIPDDFWFGKHVQMGTPVRVV